MSRGVSSGRSGGLSKISEERFIPLNESRRLPVLVGENRVVLVGVVWSREREGMLLVGGGGGGGEIASSGRVGVLVGVARGGVTASEEGLQVPLLFGVEGGE